MDDHILPINDRVQIPMSELSYKFSHSSGPGGQHVQKSSTRVELRFDVANSPSLTKKDRERVLKQLAGYIDTEGILHLTSQTERSQHRNREEVVERFETLMREALKRRKKRKATKPSAAAKEKRLESKHKHSKKKQARGQVRNYE